LRDLKTCVVVAGGGGGAGQGGGAVTFGGGGGGGGTTVWGVSLASTDFFSWALILGCFFFLLCLSSD